MRVLILLFAALPIVAQNDVLMCSATDDPEGIVCAAASGQISEDEAIERLAQDLRVSRDSARAFVLATLPLLRLGFDEPIDDASRARAEAALLGALERERNRAPLIGVLARVAAATNPREAAFSALLPLIGDDVDSAMAAAFAVEPNDSLIFLAHAYARHPENVQIVEAIGDRAWSTEVRATFGPLRITAAGVELRNREADIYTVATQLRALADLGLPQLIVAAFEALPEPLQRQLMDRVTDETDDVRWDVVASALIVGKTDLVAEYAGILWAPTDDRTDEPARVLLTASLPGAKVDAFEVIAAQFNDVVAPKTTGVSGLLLARFAAEHGYNELAADLLADVQTSRMSDEEIEQPLRDAVDILQRYAEPVSDGRTAADIPPDLLAAAMRELGCTVVERIGEGDDGVVAAQQSCEVGHFVIDPSGTRALIALDKASAGVTYRLMKTREGRWNVTAISSWGD